MSKPTPTKEKGKGKVVAMPLEKKCGPPSPPPLIPLSPNTKPKGVVIGVPNVPATSSPMLEEEGSNFGDDDYNLYSPDAPREELIEEENWPGP